MFRFFLSFVLTSVTHFFCTPCNEGHSDSPSFLKPFCFLPFISQWQETLSIFGIFLHKTLSNTDMRIDENCKNINYPFLPLPFPPCLFKLALFPSLCISCVLFFTYHWARRASIRSSCCSAVGPGFSEWLAPYPESCWALLSTAPYLHKQTNASFSWNCVFLPQLPGLTMRRKVSGSAGRHKIEWENGRL